MEVIKVIQAQITSFDNEKKQLQDQILKLQKKLGLPQRKQ
jgi:hypothetical protein